jgi:hypothetical protein
MSKELNKWLDEFVENGADPTNVSDWSESAGGDCGAIILNAVGTYTIDVNEFSKAVENVPNDFFGEIGYRMNINASGSEINDLFIVATHFGTTTKSLRLNNEILFSFDSAEKSLSEAILDNQESLSIHIEISDSSDFLVGIIRESNSPASQQFDISKVLVKVEETTE